VLRGVLSGHCEEDVNLVNAPSLADERGIGVSERSETVARDFTDLVRVSIVSGADRYRVVGTALGRQDRPHLLEAWGQRFNLQLDEGAHMALFRYSDLPGMMGRVGTVLGERGVNISSAAVGRQPPGDDGRANDVAVMVVTTDSPVPRDVVEQIAGSDGFLAGRAVSL
jgi:D-3-phosphoglycerate dehydrogenase / 2-oxoglutarate reductase